MLKNGMRAACIQLCSKQDVASNLETDPDARGLLPARLVHEFQIIPIRAKWFIGLTLGLARMRDVMDEKFYTDLKGGLMESLGQLLRTGVKLYVYPWLDRETGKIVTIDGLEVAPNLRHLFAHLVENHFIEDIRGYNPDFLSVNSGAVLQKLQSGDASWEQQVPPPIAEVIKAKKLFGCK